MDENKELSWLLSDQENAEKQGFLQVEWVTTNRASLVEVAKSGIIKGLVGILEDEPIVILKKFNSKGKPFLKAGIPVEKGIYEMPLKFGMCLFIAGDKLNTKTAKYCQETDWQGHHHYYVDGDLLDEDE